MAQTNLTPEEKAQIIEAINKGLEPSPDLLPKIFPKIAEKFDVAALDRAKIPTLEYAGKRTKATILAEAIAGIGAAPLQTVRCFGGAVENEWKNMIVQGDNLQFLKTCYKNVDPLIKDKVKGKVKLIYIDPPFATKSDFGGKNGEYSYADKVDRAQFVETMRERLIYLRELLAEDGSIYVHLDQKMNSYVKVIMDEIFGKDKFRNEIIWCYNGATNDKKNFTTKHDIILRYTKTDNFIFNADDIRVPYDPETVARFNRNAVGYALNSKDDEVLSNKGKIPEDWWEFCIIRNQPEKTGYPTQKPEQLIERIIKASSNKDDLIMDCFAGSGTTGAVAEKLGRKWIMCDFGKHAIYVIQKRILNISESKKIKAFESNDETRCEKCKSVIKESFHYYKCTKCQSILEKEDKPIKEKYGQAPKPFCVVSSGAYDFSHVMDLRKNKETYVDFVLGLFQLVRDDEKATKFRLANIYSLKENNPVEVYPVWDDRYLRDVRIDEIYLQGIIDQAGGRLRGDYYIITPETCTNVGETTLKNQDGKDVVFHILSFPYKILEDISQKLELQDQPSSANDINNLVTSTSFYFNEDVEIEVVRTEEGLNITKFDTKILDGSGNRFDALSGLAMLLIDLDYVPGKPFDMDVAVYAKEIGEDGTCKVADLTPSVGIIAIDKHGNESKPFQIK